jgi:hypothetical protein
VVVRDAGLELGAELAGLRARLDDFCPFTGDCDRLGDVREAGRLDDDEGGRLDLSVRVRGLDGSGANGGGIFGRAGEASGFWGLLFLGTVNSASLFFSGSPRLGLQLAERNAALRSSWNWPCSSYISNECLCSTDTGQCSRHVAPLSLGKEILNSHFPEFLGDTVDAHFNAQFECVGLLTDLGAKLSCSLVYWRSSH